MPNLSLQDSQEAEEEILCLLGGILPLAPSLQHPLSTHAFCLGETEAADPTPLWLQAGWGPCGDVGTWCCWCPVWDL